MFDFQSARRTMVESQLVARGIVDARVIGAMGEVPRECFVAPGDETSAYEDGPLPIGAGQTISQPYIVALMAQLAAIGPGDRVLEIGTGSGYAAAVLSKLAARVFTVERHAALAEAARVRLAELGLSDTEVVLGDGTLGLPSAAPFDAILAAAGGPNVPSSWKDQLALGGRLVMPVGGRDEVQELIRLVRIDATEFREETFGGVRFVPLIGAEGFVLPNGNN